MQRCLIVTVVGFLSGVAGANAADNTVHDRNNGVSLTFPQEWTSKPPSGEAMLLDIESTENEGLSCMVSGSLYDPKGSPPDPRQVALKRAIAQIRARALAAGASAAAE